MTVPCGFGDHKVEGVRIQRVYDRRAVHLGTAAKAVNTVQEYDDIALHIFLIQSNGPHSSTYA